MVITVFKIIKQPEALPGSFNFDCSYLPDIPDQLKERFDVIYSLLTMHHLQNPRDVANRVLRDEFLKKGGRLVLMDYERDPTKQIFHPVHLKEGVHYEHDGFTEEIMKEWFSEGGDSWDLKELQVTKVPIVTPVDPDYEELIPRRQVETYNLLMTTCTLK